MADFSTSRFSPGLPELLRSLREGKAEYDSLEAAKRDEVVRFFMDLQTGEPPGPDILRRKLYDELGDRPEVTIAIVRDMVGRNAPFGKRDESAFFAWLGKVEGGMNRASFAALFSLVPEQLAKAYNEGVARLYRSVQLPGD